MGISYGDRMKIKRIRFGIESYIERLKKFQGRHRVLDDSITELEEGLDTLDYAVKDAFLDPDYWKDDPNMWERKK